MSWNQKMKILWKKENPTSLQHPFQYPKIFIWNNKRNKRTDWANRSSGITLVTLRCRRRRRNVQGQCSSNRISFNIISDSPSTDNIKRYIFFFRVEKQSCFLLWPSDFKWTFKYFHRTLKHLVNSSLWWAKFEKLYNFWTSWIKISNFCKLSTARRLLSYGNSTKV